MRNIFSLWEDIRGLKDKDPETLLYKVLPHNLLRLLQFYFRLQVEGLENVPKKGAAIILPNHSGFAGFDAFLLAHSVYENIRRVPRVLTHKFWFASQFTSIPAQRLGFVEATSLEAARQLQKNNLLILFPEGEDGNFKPSQKRYRLQPFHKGFIRLAIEQQCPIVPTVILGAEESHLNLKKLKLEKWVPGLQAPLPLNLFPLPAKWKIRFLPAIELPYTKAALEDAELLEEIASDLREKLQAALNSELAVRGSAFFS